MGTFGGVYQTGTITVAANATAVDGIGVVWSDVLEGDWLFANGNVGIIDSVDPTAYDDLVLKAAWTGGAITSGAYMIIKMSWLRYDPAITQTTLRALLVLLQGQSFIYSVTGSAPDPGVGEDGQWALKTNDGSYKTWLHTGGVWVLQPGFSGLITSLGGITYPSAPAVVGDILAADSTTDFARVAGNTTTTRKFLRQTGTGSASAAPAWDTLVSADVPVLIESLLGNPTSTVGGCQSIGLGPGLAFSGTNLVAGCRTPLTADTTFYVSTSTGSDSSVAGSIGAPWQTIQHGVNVLSTQYDFAGYKCTLQIVGGTYNEDVALNFPCVGGVLKITGDTTTPANVIVNSSVACFQVNHGATLQLEGVKLISAANGLSVTAHGTIIVTNNIEFGNCGYAHMQAIYNSLIQFWTATYRITGTATIHCTCSRASDWATGVLTPTHCVIIGSYSFSGGFINFNRHATGAINLGLTFDTSAATFTGSSYRYILVQLSMFDSSGQPNLLPGNTAGSTSGGALYF